MSRKIVYGVCGIGHGHLYRQMPVIDALADNGHAIAIFAYGQSLPTLCERYAQDDNVTVIPVAVPYYNGSRGGLDFEAAASNPANAGVDFFGINMRAMAAAKAHLGGAPDLCVSDYEPVAAQMAYVFDAPLVTIDQQSKYMVGNGLFPRDLDGLGFQDEVERLRMMFPRAEERLACSFFKVAKPRYVSMPVTIIPPILSDRVKTLDPKPEQGTIMVYISSQQAMKQAADDVGAILGSFPKHTFHIFAPDAERYAAPNVRPYTKGGEDFPNVLARADALISTAGHSLLSEAMHLKLPVFAMPLPVYEQRINASVIEKGGFGMNSSRLKKAQLGVFFEKLAEYRKAIATDTTHLVRGCGKNRALQVLGQHLS